MANAIASGSATPPTMTPETMLDSQCSRRRSPARLASRKAIMRCDYSSRLSPQFRTDMDLTRLFIAFVLGVSLVAPATAQQYPSKPVRIIVAFTPGTGIDILAREVGQQMAQ